MPRRVRRWLAAGVAVALLMAAWRLTRRPEDTLSARATEYALPGSYADYSWRIGWLDSDRIIAFGKDEQNRIGIFAVRLSDHSVQPMQPLDTLWQLHLRRKDTSGHPLVSPDGRWVIRDDFAQPNPCWLVARTDGSAFVKIPIVSQSRGGEVLHWLADSKHMLAHYYSPAANLDAVQTMMSLYDTSGRATPYTAGMRSSNGFAYFSAPGNRVIAVDFLMSGADVRQSAEAAEIDPAHPARPLSHFRIALPSGWYSWEYTFSPDTQRIAWKLRERTADDSADSPGPFVSWLRDRVGTGRRVRYRFSVSRSDGSDLREIGTISLKDDGDAPYSLIWSPDGTRIAFVRSGKLYVARAD